VTKRVGGHRPCMAAVPRRWADQKLAGCPIRRPSAGAPWVNRQYLSLMLAMPYRDAVVVAPGRVGY